MAPGNQQGGGNQQAGNQTTGNRSGINTDIVNQLQQQLGQVNEAATAMEITRNVLKNAQANGVTVTQARTLLDEAYQGSTQRQ